MMISDLIYPELKTTDKLKHPGDNYIIWKLKIDFVFANHRVDYVLTDPIPTEDDAESRDKWLSDDRTCRRIIFLTTDKEFRPRVPNYDNLTAKSMMDYINTHCNLQSIYRSMDLFRNFINHRMSEGSHVNQHIFQMRALGRKLEMGGVPVPDEIQAMVLLNSLPGSWADVVEGLVVNNAVKEGEFSVDNICRRLMVAGEMRRWREGDDDDYDPNKDMEKICYYCGKPDHFHSSCPDQDGIRSFKFNLIDDDDDDDDAMAVTKKAYAKLKTAYRLNHMGTWFTLWKDRISEVFEDRKVNYVLKDRKVKKVSNTWLNDDLTCRHIILGTMEEDLFLSFHNYPTAKTLMETLNYFFNSPSLGRGMNMFSKYVGRRMSDDTNVREHIANLDRMEMEMETAGVKVPDEMKGVVLMKSLPESLEKEYYLHFVNMDKKRDKEKGLSLETVRKTVTDVGDIRDSMMARNEEYQSYNWKPKRVFRGNCYSCGRQGHCQSNCPY